MKRRTFIFVTLALLVWSLIATGFALYYYRAYTDFSERTTKELTRISMKVSILINYGNGTKMWHNDTLLPVGASVFNSTAAIAKVGYTTYASGIFVTAIDEVGQNTMEKSWMWWYWNATTIEWNLEPVSCDEFILHDGDVVAWYYEKVTTWPPEAPP